MSKKRNVATYDDLKEKVFLAIETKGAIGDFIPPETASYWRIGGKLVWHAEELLEELAADLRKKFGNKWNAKDLVKMFRLYLRYPTAERLSGRCVGRERMDLDELLDVGK